MTRPKTRDLSEWLDEVERQSKDDIVMVMPTGTLIKLARLAVEQNEASKAWMKVESESRPNTPMPDLGLRAMYRKEAVSLTKKALSRFREIEAEIE